MSWSIGCCFVCLFFDYFFSVGGCVFLCRIFFMSRYADALCIGPWRMICVVMHRMWVTMAKSMSMAGIVMGRCGIRMSTNDNNPYTTHPPPTQQSAVWQYPTTRSPPLSTLETCTDQYMLRWMPIIDTKGYHQAASSSTSWPMSM